MRRWLVVIAAAGLVVGVAVYLYAGLQVYDELSAVSGVCHSQDEADTPESFTVDGLAAADVEPYAMPAPRDVEFASRDTQQTAGSVEPN